MALVVPDICRFVVNQSLEGREVVNILDMKIDTTGSVTSREDAIVDQAQVILQEWHDEIRPMVIDDLQLLSVSWVDLDEDDGSTGTTTDGSGAAEWPSEGTSLGLPMPANVAVLVHKNATVSRRSRNGRMYLCGWSEGINDAANGNAVTPAELDTINGNLDDFLTNINQTGGGLGADYASALVVVHTLSSVNPDPPPKLLIEANGYDDVESLTADPVFATIRRRLRG